MKRKPNRKTWVISQLRRISMKWPPRNKVYRANRREIELFKKDGTPYKKKFYEHQCNICKEWFRAKDIQLDHINPVVDLSDHSGLSEEEYIGKFVVSLLSYEENWQKVCAQCHDIKTKNEQKIRKTVKKVDTPD